MKKDQDKILKETLLNIQLLEAFNHFLQKNLEVNNKIENQDR